jgi:hypothetical protein
MRDRDGAILGFAAMATSPGPSWPLWVTTPDTPSFRRGAALFGIDRAAPAIVGSGRALVVDDCRDAIRLHRAGEREAVAVIRSPITRAHLGQLAASIGVEAVDVVLEAQRREEVEGRTQLVRPRRAGEAAATDDESAAPETASAESASRVVPDPERPLSRLQKALLGSVAVILGAGIPLGWTAALHPDRNAPGGPGSKFVVAVGGVAATYVALTVLASLVAGQRRKRSRARRMRQPWERGLTEWQPTAWTYHRFEEVLVGAALVSLVVCLVLFVTIGGFGG